MKYLQIVNDLTIAFPSAPLAKADFAAQLEFRYQMRRFERFSENAAQAEGIAPLRDLPQHIKSSLILHAEESTPHRFPASPCSAARPTNADRAKTAPLATLKKAGTCPHFPAFQ